MQTIAKDEEQGTNKMIYGYARVSTKGQNEARQITALTKAGVSESNIVIDKQSGKDFKREGYQRLIAKLTEGDVLIAKSLDRLGRDYEEILSEWRTIVLRLVIFA